MLALNFNDIYFCNLMSNDLNYIELNSSFYSSVSIKFRASIYVF